MKVCTACNATYSDDTLNFCLTDGTTLIPEKQMSFNQVPFSYDPNSWSQTETPTQISSAPKTYPNSDPPPTVATPFSSFTPPNSSYTPPNSSYTPPNQSYNPSYVPQSFSAPPSNRPNRSVLYLCIVAGTLVFGIVIGLVVASRWSKPDGNTSVVTKSPSTNSNVATIYTNPSPAVNAETNKTTSPKLEVTGTWKGNFDKGASTLNITSQTGDSFSGTLSKAGFLIEVVGQINQDKRTVSIKETKVLKTASGSVWNLGQNNGMISPSGKIMNGTGKDKKITYNWNFTKESN